MNLANKISIIRIILVPLFIAFIVYSKFTFALIVFIICMASDALDGIVARMNHQETNLGRLLDPMADKLLLVTGFILLSVASNIPAHLRFPPYVALIIVSRDVLMILGCLVIYLLKGKVDIKPTVVGKITTFFQMLSIVSILTRFPYSMILWNVAVILTVVSGLGYLRAGSRMLNEKR